MVEEQKQILELLILGCNNREIAEKLNYSIRTVERRFSELFKLYKVSNRNQLSIEYLAEKLQ